jgi:hypothetical protein
MLTVAGAVGVLAVVGASPAHAATQIGETFDPAPCDGGFTYFQSSSPGNQYAAPSPGVITAWSFQADPGSPTTLRFKVGRRIGTGSQFLIIGHSPLKTAAPGSFNTYTDVGVPVEAGDVIGLYVAGNDPCASGFLGSSSPYEYAYVAGDSPPGSAPTFAELSGFQFDVSATLEPDCDSDGFGDESQDPDLSACQPQQPPSAGRTVTLDANKNKIKKGKRVRLSGRVAETRQGACAANQPVQLQRKRPSQTTFTTVEQLQTDAAGRFSAKEKVKKTSEYRAQVAGSATCGAGLSNTEKVKVKKKK